MNHSSLRVVDRLESRLRKGGDRLSFRLIFGRKYRDFGKVIFLSHFCCQESRNVFYYIHSKAFALNGAVRIPQIVGCGARGKRRESKLTRVRLMRTTFFKAFNLLLVSFGLWASNARACDVLFDFNIVDPQTLMPPPYDQFGHSHWVMNPDLSGNDFLSIVDNTTPSTGQQGTLIMRDCDNGAIIASFAIDMDVRIGAPTANANHRDGNNVGQNWAPADGLSINYARAGDPVFTMAPVGYACTPVPAPECSYTAEEGTTTGLSVSLDEWDSNPSFGGGGDVIGITIRVDNTIIANYPLPILNGNSTDLTSLQTYDGFVDGSNPGVRQFAPLHMAVTPDAHVIVRYKLNPDLTPHEITPAGGLQTTFAPSPAQLVFGARTGGANGNKDVDNIHIVTVVSQRPVFGPPINITPIGFTFQIFDSPTVTFGPTLALSLTLDGNPVTPDAGSVVKNGVTTSGTISVSPSTPFASGSTHTVAEAWTSSDGGHDTGSHKFNINPYIPIPASFAARTVVDPNLDAARLKVRIHQLPVPSYG